MLRHLKLLPFAFAALALSFSCAAGSADDPDDCPVGSEGCPCTQGGSCDGSLACLSDLCVDPSGSGGSGAGSTSGGGGAGMGGEGTGAFNVGGGGGGGQCALGGCKAVDVLFAMDGSGSMQEEISALAAAQAFNQVVAALADLNCGDIDYRIGVTDDNNAAFRVPNGWNGADPWFDSTSMDDAQIATAFSGAASLIIQGSGTEVGCEHVLSNSVTLVTSDLSGFVRPEALLVLVMVTDVDDYGAYDNINGNDCGLGCTVTGAPVNTLYDSLVTLKGGDPKGVSTIVVAGDPNVIGGVNFCGQPGSCGCSGLDCGIFHADRLWAFAGMQVGSNGYAANLCDGPQSVPAAVQTALTTNIDLACQEFEPPS
ncbi:MAG: VWA domain-containing protein [Polyangiaceae bacterium]|jgi:hypothetical protein|nr:VWA domain-containing protein [Polyangiaceae bacterium]MBK8938037.1 VWA domain-containing protein [Polyangiaceae bacterium]